MRLSFQNRTGRLIAGRASPSPPSHHQPRQPAVQLAAVWCSKAAWGLNLPSTQPSGPSLADRARTCPHTDGEPAGHHAARDGAGCNGVPRAPLQGALRRGAVTVLHDHDRVRSDTDSFVEPLRRATGVWMMGGSLSGWSSRISGQNRARLRELLDRGGVIGGESAGAMIQGSWLDTTDGGFTPAILKVMQAHAAGGGLG